VRNKLLLNLGAEDRMVFDADLNNPFLARFFQQAPDFDTRNAESFGDLFLRLFLIVISHRNFSEQGVI